MIDLHTHSTVSDGTDPPERIPWLAADAGCTAVALTDHDRLDGVPAARAAAGAAGVELVAGCELSCHVAAPGTMHLLVYFVDGGEGPLQDRLGELQRARAERNTRMVDVLSNDLGLPITLDEVQAEAGGDGVGRPHVAAVLVRNGVVATIGEAFDQFLAKGRPGYVDRERLRPEDAMRLAAASGGVTVLAHPSTLAQPPGTLAATIAELAAAGLAGVEAFYGRYGPGEREEIAALARRHGLVPTGGSDHHGAYKPDLRVGVGRGDLDVPDEALAALRERRP